MPTLLGWSVSFLLIPLGAVGASEASWSNKRVQLLAQSARQKELAPFIDAAEAEVEAMLAPPEARFARLEAAQRVDVVGPGGGGMTTEELIAELRARQKELERYESF